MNFFWNRSERRLRAFWRLLLQSIVMFALSGVISAVVIITMFLIPGGASAVLDRTDMYVALLEYYSVNPFASLIIMLASFLAVAISVGIAARIFDRRPLAAYGFNFNCVWWLDLVFGLGLGAFLLAVIFVIEWAFGWIVILPRSEQVIPALPLVMVMGLLKFILVGVQEELISRGYHLVNIAEGLANSTIGRRNAIWLAYLLSSLIFGLLHLGNPNMSFLSTLNLCLAGLFLGLPFILTGELALSIGLHITWNYFQGFIFGFPVSGLPSYGSLILIQQGGPTLWAGGSFGPEGGLLSIMMMLLGAGLVILWVKRTRGKVALDEGIGEYGGRTSQDISRVISPE